MSQTYFEVLGLTDHPEDLRSLKKAYAAKLKITHPEDDPTGFMELRDAYEIGKQYLEYRIQSEVDEIESDFEPKTDDTQNYENDYIDVSQLHIDSSKHYFVDVGSNDEANHTQDNVVQTQDKILLSKFKKLIDTPDKSNLRTEWIALFEQRTDLSIDEYLDFENGFSALLARKYDNWRRQKQVDTYLPRPLSSEIETLIFNRMGWGDSTQADDGYETDIQVLNDIITTSQSPFETQSINYQNFENRRIIDTSKKDSKSSFWTVFMILFVVIGIGRFILLVDQSSSPGSALEYYQSSEYKNLVKRKRQEYYAKMDAAGVLYDPVTGVVNTQSLQTFEFVDGIGFDKSYPRDTLLKILGLDKEKSILWESTLNATGIRLNGQEKNSRQLLMGSTPRDLLTAEQRFFDTTWLNETYETYKNAKGETIVRTDQLGPFGERGRWILKGEPYDLSRVEYSEKTLESFGSTDIVTLEQIMSTHRPKGAIRPRVQFDIETNEWVLRPLDGAETYQDIIARNRDLQILMADNSELADFIKQKDRALYIDILETKGLEVSALTGEISLSSLRAQKNFDANNPWNLIAEYIAINDALLTKHRLNAAGLYIEGETRF